MWRVHPSNPLGWLLERVALLLFLFLLLLIPFPAPRGTYGQLFSALAQLSTVSEGGGWGWLVPQQTAITIDLRVYYQLSERRPPRTQDPGPRTLANKTFPVQLHAISNWLASNLGRDMEVHLEKRRLNS